MINCFIESFDDVLTENECNYIVDLLKTNDINAYCELKRRGIMNAALDDLVPQVLMFFNSDWFIAIASIASVSTAISELVKFITKKIKQKNLKKVTNNKVENEKPKINIQIENVMILNPKNDITNFESYYKESFIIAKDFVDNNNKQEIIVEYDMQTKRAKALTLEEYATNA